MKSNSGFYISRIKQVNTRLLNKFLAQKNITAFNGEQGRILHVLWENDGISNRELSKKSGLAMSSLTTMLERMEEKNLLIRKFCPTDKRKSLIFLTNYAKSLKSEYDEISDKMNEISFEGISDEDRLAFEATLEKVLYNFERAEQKFNKK
ncbi:MarR family transcriptional regulator [Leptotrichia sp. oral taxon 847]|uniref:MarR family transcriptional regulator n=1 Tax=Leptotrichia sp. oral taxon 847 TaxID=1785996 RepID=UPI0007684505|nr:MarR family transcriptional regulator [Leptotrichia sp. oral taxon 847]AMD94686.1 MarR family transcriptional regulator [Leptotrichia sp. oral taxon 847]